MSEETTPIAPGVTEIETIKCAAVKRSDDIIIAGRNHGFCIQYSPLGTCKENSQQGFITSKARFVSRTEAGKIAFTAGQTEKLIDLLFSEDITGDNPWAGEIIEQLQSRLAVAEEKIERLRDALQELYDEQNGPPLLRDEKEWRAAMDKAEKLLTGDTSCPSQ